MRKFIRVLSVVIIVFLLEGCGKDSETMTAKEFQTVMEKKGFTVVDQTESAVDSTYQKIYVAIDENKYSFEYYFMRDNNSAITVYDYAVDNLKAVYGNDDTVEIWENSSEKSAVCKVNASDYYCEVVRKDNTVLYVTSYVAFAEDAKAILEELGY